MLTCCPNCDHELDASKNADGICPQCAGANGVSANASAIHAAGITQNNRATETLVTPPVVPDALVTQAVPLPLQESDTVPPPESFNRPTNSLETIDVHPDFEALQQSPEIGRVPSTAEATGRGLNSATGVAPQTGRPELHGTEHITAGNAPQPVANPVEPTSTTSDMLGHFQLLKQLGAGAFGAVFKAHDTKLDRIVALKIPKCGNLTATETESFLREARAAAQLNHSQIVGVHEVGQLDGRIYIVTDFINGMAMDDWLKTTQPAHAQTAELVATIADALDHAHGRGVVHRDLKPANILLDSELQPHIADFGLAKRDNGDMSQTTEGSILGTPAYMAPEQAAGNAKDADGRADIYSIGVMLFEMLTGQRPFAGNLQLLLVQIVHEEPPRPRNLNADIPQDLETICLRCLEKDPTKRFQTAGELAAELRRYLHNEPILSRPISNVERLWRWCGRNRMVAGLIAAVAVAVLVGGSLSFAFGVMAWSQEQQNQVLEESSDEAKRKAIEAAVREDLERIRRRNADARAIAASQAANRINAQMQQQERTSAQVLREREQQELSDNAVDQAVAAFAANRLGNSKNSRNSSSLPNGGNIDLQAQQKLLNQLKGNLGKLNSTLAKPRGR